VKHHIPCVVTMKTLCALALMPLWQCLAEECSETLGSCAGKQASLMQFKSLNQKKQALSLEAQEGFSSKLAAYQKFTNEMVEQYGQPASPEPTNDVKLAVHTVLDFIDDMYEHLNGYHEQDVALASRCANPALYCKKTLMNPKISNNLKQAKNRSEQAALDHSECVTDETAGVVGDTGYQCGGVNYECKQACEANAACDEYDRGRGAKPANADIPEQAKLPVCVNNGDFADDHIKAQTDSAELEDMEQCLEDTKIWLDYLYPLYSNCQRGEDCCEQAVQRCDQLQTTFESARCLYASQSNILCSELDTCHQAREDECHDTCGIIEMRSGARAADNETGQRLVCLLHTLFGEPNPDSDDRSDFLPRPNATQRPVELEKCKTANINTTYWGIPCSESDSLEGTEVADWYECPASDITKPCSAEFTEQAYLTMDMQLQLPATAGNYECTETAQRGFFRVISACEECL